MLIFNNHNLEIIQAVYFIERIVIDSLALATGIAHGLYEAEPKIGLERLEKIKSKVEVALVLHAGFYVPDALIIETIERGITKVNIATELKIAFLDELKTCLIEKLDADDLRRYLADTKTAIKN